MQNRSFRTDFFRAIADEITSSASGSDIRLLELGSGFGNLAHYILTSIHNIESYVAVDSSPALHGLAVRRLGSLARRVQFVQQNFGNSDWAATLGDFNVVVTHQAIHELSHKRNVEALHRQARELLIDGGIYLTCEYHAGGPEMKNQALYMTLKEQQMALSAAGFSSVRQSLLKGDLVLFRADL